MAPTTSPRSRPSLTRGTKATIIFGCAQDKPAAQLLPMLESIAERFIFTSIQSPRSEPTTALRPFVSIEAHTTDGLIQALALSERFPDPVLITGSLFLAGEAIARLTQKTTTRSTSQ